MEDIHCLLQLAALLLLGEAGKFTSTCDAEHAAFRDQASVLITVQADGPVSLLPLADFTPKIMARGFLLEHGISVVRNDGQKRFQLVLQQRFLHFCPYLPVHGRAKVVKSQKVACFHGAKSAADTNLQSGW